MKPILKFKQEEIITFASRYKNNDGLMLMKETILSRGYITKKELEVTANWKSPRSAWHINKNTDDYIAEITQFAFKTNNERAKIESLTLLNGVLWPTASAILHLFHRDKYPILDFRALWSVSLPVPISYTFDFWWPYVEFCRNIAQSAKVDMRTLDRALWQYSKNNQLIV